MSRHKFHGRHENAGATCQAPGCTEAGEFRAPGARRSSFDGPGDWLWFCLEHVRQFNAGYDFFKGMSADEILDAQSPVAGWRSSRAYDAHASVDSVPRWADYHDPLEAIAARARLARERKAQDRHPQQRYRANAHRGLSAEDRQALHVLGLAPDTDRPQLRRRYSELVRRYHPDRNGGDRSHEHRLQQVVTAYQHLRRSRFG
ncbi:J domain-containing protein [Croceicoccus sp. F390]|uniref:J domain-containing protein n=1 Tax=Croceicoccus esteveae TaxID=3075597 RepID=A0ABU2ZJJ5_9SPHN|nr:J domain-containing protein [Croceicoccus sp. F390]MDT0575582.1 J domain-containing protein [Croceicoccus sp. F390]